MIFTSLKFLLFLTVAVAGYFLLPKKIRWVWLLAVSGYFYLCAGVKYSVYLLCSAASVYAYGIYVDRVVRDREAFLAGERSREEKKAAKQAAERRKKRGAAAVILLNVGILAVLKYADFGLATLSRLIPVLQPPRLGLVVPLGLSFYTFMAVGYCVDVCREVSEGERDPLKLLLFLSYFPHIMQGPIDRYEELAPQLFEGHPFDYDRLTRGLYRMLWGFFEKLVVADRLAILVDGILDNSSGCSGLFLAGAMVCYAIQIYADFAGYMDIALGASHIFGIDPAENFDAPYFSASVPEYWRRWHMTLGGWFRDYLFYPILRSGWCRALSKRLSAWIGKKGAGTACTCLALMAVWTATGLWHGASWHYIAWGAYYGLLIVLSTVTAPYTQRAAQRLHIDRESRFWRQVSVGKTFLLVLVGYVLFRANNTAHAVEILSRIVTKFSPRWGALSLGAFMDRKDLIAAALGCAVFVMADILRDRKVKVGDFFASLPIYVRWGTLYAAVAVILLFGVYGPEYDAISFIYFNFS